MCIQIKEILTYKGKEYTFDGTPLSPYLEKKNIHPSPTSTACWRGYVGKWLIENNHLYLTDVSNIIIEELYHKDKILADWVSGRLRIGHGDIIHECLLSRTVVYETEILFTIVDGEITSYLERDNTPLRNDEDAILNKELELSFNLNPDDVPEFRKYWDKVSSENNE